MEPVIVLGIIRQCGLTRHRNIPYPYLHYQPRSINYCHQGSTLLTISQPKGLWIKNLPIYEPFVFLDCQVFGTHKRACEGKEDQTRTGQIHFVFVSEKMQSTQRYSGI